MKEKYHHKRLGNPEHHKLENRWRGDKRKEGGLA
jgi:hypothetical protein